MKNRNFILDENGKRGEGEGEGDVSLVETERYTSE